MEKKLMLSLVTTLPRQKAPKEDMFFFSSCPPRPGPQATAGSLRFSASPQASTPRHLFSLLWAPVHLHIPGALIAAVLVLVTEVIQRQ